MTVPPRGRPLRPLPALVALGLLAAAGCGGPTVIPQAAPHRTPAALDDREVSAIARLLRYEDRRVYDADGFAALMDGAGEEVRRRGVMAAGRAGDTAAVPLLLRLLGSDPSAAVRADAAFALGELGDTSALVLDGLEAAVAGDWVPIRDGAVPVVIEVVAALGKLGGDRAHTLVRDALRAARRGDTDRHARVAAEALLTIWKLDDRAGNVPAVVPYLGVSDPELRWRAAYSLMRGGDPAALQHLLALDDDPNHRVRAYIARALDAPAADSAGVAEEAIARLTGSLSDPHPHARINALGSLGGYAERAPRDAMAALIHDPDASVGVAAVRALARLGERAADPLAAALEHEELPVALRGTILEQLAGVAPDRALPAVGRWADGDVLHRYFAARALAALPPDAGIEIAARLARDADRRVAGAALQAAGALARQPAGSPGMRARLRRLLLRAYDSGEPVHQAAALPGLAPLAQPDDLPALLAGFRRSAERAPDHPLSRHAALATLAVLKELADGATSGAEEIRERLFSGPRPTDRWILRAAAELGDGWGDPPEAVADDDPRFYEDVVRRYVAAPMAGSPRPTVTMETARGPIVVELLAEEAPLTVHNFMALAERGFFDDGVWHRVVPNFVLQDGAPGGLPNGGPGWAIRDEINRVRYGRGMLGMALSGPDTGGSQWFITHSPQPHLDGGYTIFGRVIDGMAAADAVLQGEPIPSVRVRR